MILASKTARDLNDDPTPYLRVHTDLGPMGRFEQPFPGPEGYSFAFKPRAAYDRTQHYGPNRLLVDFRAIDAGREEYARWVRDIECNPEFWKAQPGGGLLAGATVGYESAHIEHALRVLTRLAHIREETAA